MILTPEEIEKIKEDLIAKTKMPLYKLSEDVLIEAAEAAVLAKLQVNDEGLVDIVLHVLLSDDWNKGTYTQASERIVKALSPYLAQRIQVKDNEIERQKMNWRHIKQQHPEDNW